jgi:ubiquinone/menaquinone biosynthesis C-methylase UbiE
MSKDRIRDHYASHDIFQRLTAALRASAGESVKLSPQTLAPLDHFHRGGLASTGKLAERLAPQQGDRILDIGCGIGGPARWIAASFGCHVTGIDLTPEYCSAATELSNASGMSDRVRFLEGDAIAMPFADQTFDGAFSQSALMNVADKPTAFAEAFRVLKPGKPFAISVVGAGPAGAPYLPLPFATAPEDSFLSPPEVIKQDLEAAGFNIVVFNDMTTEVAAQQREYLRRLKTEGLPPLGWHILLGRERSLVLQANAARSFIEGRLVELEILVRRPF